jgi:Kelch motif
MNLSASFALLASLVFSCLTPHDAPPRLAPKLTAAVQGPHWVGPALSGSWFQADRSGEGFILQILPDGNAVAAWFTFPAAGEAGEQVWLMAAGGEVRGNKLIFDQVYRPRGGRFGPGFDPGAIENPHWGRWEFEFSDCRNATLRYSGSGDYGEGQRTLTRITHVDQLDCAGNRALASGGARALDGLRARSGNWYVAGRSGEGWFIEDLPGARMLVYWFTYDAAGNQLWLAGVGQRSEANTVAVDVYVARGTRFGAGFDPAAVQQQRWGRLEFDFTDCNTAAFRYAADDAAYGSGAYTAQRVTALAGAHCINGTPQLRHGGSWVELAGLPGTPQSEHAAVAYDGKIYALGGFGDNRGFKAYDIAGGSWTTLAPLPGGRHHLAAFALQGKVYMVGGEPIGGGDQSSHAYRYDIAAGSWEPVPELSSTYGSQSALLNGRAYTGNSLGELEEFDPRQRAVRRIRAPDFIERDHAQVLAYQGEIWVLGGRWPDQRSVAIYDPVSESWRAGPGFINVRGGFAAAVVDEQILITGGERLSGNQMLLVSSTEVFVAGATRWATGIGLPQAVHGVPGASAGGRFYALSGSRQAGLATGATGKFYALKPELLQQ